MTTQISTSEASRYSLQQPALCEAPPVRSHRWGRWLIAFLLVWCGLLVVTYEVVDLPPYQDQAAGLWAEADFLVESGFNYYALRYVEPHYQDDNPGSRSYMISVLPTLTALLLIAGPTVQFAFVVSHVAAAAFGAMAIVLVFYALRGVVGNLGAALTSLALLSTPLFLTQVRIVGMDVPVAAFGLLAAVMVWRKRFVAAAGVSMMAFFMKASGGLVTMATITYLAVLLLLMPRDEDPRWRRTCRQGLLVNIAALVAQTLIVAWGDTSVSIIWGNSWSRVWSLPYAIYWCPDLAVVLLICTALSLIAVMQYFGASNLRPRGKGRFSQVRWLLYNGMRRHDVFILCWIVVIGMLMASSLYIAIPRYLTPAVPFLFVLSGIVLFSRPNGRKWAVALAVVLIAFNVVNVNGDLYPDVEWAASEMFAEHPVFDARFCMFTERSREYLADQLSTIAAAQRIEEQYADHPILAPLPQQFYLTRPRLGYVTRSLQAFDTGSLPRAMDHFREAIAVASANGAFNEPIFFWQGRSRMLLPPPEPGDEIIYKDDLSPQLIVYHKHLESLSSLDDHELADWLLQRTWGQPWLAFRLNSRARWFIDKGRLEQAMAETTEALRLEPDNQQLHELRHTLRVRRVAELKEAGQIERAFAEMRQWLDDEPANEDLHRLYEDSVVARTAALVEAGDFAEACATVADSLQSLPTSRRLQQLLVSAVDRSMDALTASGQLDQALQLVREARRRRPDDAQLAESEREIIRRQDEQREIAARFPMLDPSSAGHHDAAGFAALDRGLAAWIMRFTDLSASPLSLTLASDAQPTDDDTAEDESAAASAYRSAVAACEDTDLGAAADALTAALREGLPPSRAALAHLARAVILVEQGRGLDAEQNLRAAVEIVPDFAEARYQLGIVLLQTGRTGEAAEELAEAVRLAPDHRAAKHHLQAARGRLDQRGRSAVRGRRSAALGPRGAARS